MNYTEIDVDVLAEDLWNKIKDCNAEYEFFHYCFDQLGIQSYRGANGKNIRIDCPNNHKDKKQLYLVLCKDSMLFPHYKCYKCDLAKKTHSSFIGLFRYLWEIHNRENLPPFKIFRKIESWWESFLIDWLKKVDCPQYIPF
jgi:hypothetical protein